MPVSKSEAQSALDYLDGLFFAGSGSGPSSGFSGGVFDYASLIPIFSQIVTQFQTGSVSIERRSEAKDPTDPLNYIITSVAESIEAIVTGASSKRVEGSSILEGDLYVIITSDKVSSTPLDSDMVVIDGKDFQIVDIRAVPPAGTPIIYRMRVRSF